jgi:O-antigen/teichoic acid export membrane protein
MINRQFFQGLSWLVILNLLIKPAWIFLIDREIQNTVGHETYGSYFALLNLSYVLLFLSDAGLTNLLVQQVARKATVNTRQLTRLKSVLLLLYVLLCVVTGWLAGIQHWEFFSYVIGIQVLGSLFLFLRGLLTAHQLFKTDAVFSVADKGLMLVLCFPFVYGWWQPVTIGLFLQLQLIASASANLFLLLVLFRKNLVPLQQQDKASFAILRKLLPFALIILLMGMHYRLDGFLLERLHNEGALQAGIYATAYRLLDASNMAGNLTASFLFAFAARNLNQHNLLRTTLNVISYALLSIGIIISCFTWVFPTFIQNELYHTSEPAIDRVIQLTLAVLPAYYVVHLYGTVLTAMSAFGVFIRILFVCVIVNLLLNILLTPHYGAAGSSMAALVSQYGCAAACYVSATRQLSATPSLKTWLPYVAGGLCFFLFLWLLKMIIHSVWIILAASALLLIILAITQRKRVYTIVRSLTRSCHA